MESIQSAMLSMAYLLVHVSQASLDNLSLVATTSVNPILTVVHRNNVRTTNALRHALNVVKEPVVFVSRIIVLCVSVPKTTLDLPIPNVVPNVMEMLTVPEVNPHAFMASVRTLVMVLVVSELTVI